MKTEIIERDIPGFNGEYRITNNGDVYSHKYNKRILRKPFVTRLGYLVINFHINRIKIYKTVHVLVAETFLGPKPFNLEINHKDGNKANNHVDNLEYVTKSENILHSFRVLGRNPGKRHTTPIVMKDENGNHIMDFIGFHEASRILSIPANRIHESVKNNSLFNKKYRFYYK